MKIRVGILFGGSSREREVSFAGGRTVYDNLNKSIFEPVLIFVDSFGNFVELDWQYVYKGTIRDFYPPIEFLPPSENQFQIYAESLNPDKETQLSMLSKLGKPVSIEEISEKIDIAFLCLHGSEGEDGSLQGLLEWHKIPYTGSGVLASSIGINKRVQKELLTKSKFNSPNFEAIYREEWLNDKVYEVGAYQDVHSNVGYPCVVKAANQGSSIGISVLKEGDHDSFREAVNKSLFIQKLDKSEWDSLSKTDQVELVRTISDIREGLGLPLRLNEETVYLPDDLLNKLDEHFKSNPEAELAALDGENEVVVESFIAGREFSCIVIQNDEGTAIALPPTEIVKGKEVFDYRSKYLPGLSRKITPMDVPDNVLEDIRNECVDLFYYFNFNVYARIDGFLSEDGRIFLNDPNTTSGMMPSSFFFHQAAEIGLNPSNFITYLIRNSLKERIRTLSINESYKVTLNKLESLLESGGDSESKKERLAVIMGGYSFERHISVESGRNIYEKLSSSGEYDTIPIFLTGSDDNYQLYKLPINSMLKDNSDDIRDKVLNYRENPYLKKIIHECAPLLKKYGSGNEVLVPEKIGFKELKEEVDGVFIALHGRPGEDGSIQKHLIEHGLYFNGSGVESSSTTINKYITSQKLRENGFLTADARLVYRDEWEKDKEKALSEISKWFPIIAKPADDGCSAAVKKIESTEELEAFAELIFRDTQDLDKKYASTLSLKQKEEFPLKDFFLVEKFIDRNEADHFLEITGGLLTKYTSSGVQYEVFEPSEALAESGILSLEEKFLAGQGQNITPARFSKNTEDQKTISRKVREEFEAVAKVLDIEGYCRIDAFVRIFSDLRVEVIFIEVNSLPGMTPATCIYHQAAINGYKPFEFIDRILKFGKQRKSMSVEC
jgi:UDP-N-acetylmuramate--alanine ligase